ncbi:hypothetical protein [Furfurilactobacillus rossiae]|uniref:hypothetical protein n=1 Tax=Furfurilactobacillus rossiae TaxID=231049 RepID=UPI000A4ACD27|nr:hypothetical protein [Furfurilactobacillus rossiae]QFR65629.1 hypothetical protein LR814_00175 [Furfurilactobacillus rossiae]QLE61019.1 hypothetical protein LROSRS0_0972 [Furfurilactobacillus rossiae]
MKNNLKGSNNTPLLLIIVTFLSTVGYQILFGQIGILKGTANGTVISKKWLLTNFLKFVLFAGQSLLLVSVGYFSPDIKSKLNVIFRWWMSIVVMGVILALGWMFFDQWSNSSVIWLVALPMIRNTYPLLTAAIVGTLLSGFVDTTWREHKETFLIFATVLFFVPTIFNQDIFVTQINGMPTFIEYLLMCFLGVTLRHLNLNNISRMHWLLITGLTFFLAAVSLILMIPLSNFSHQGISTVNRFLQPYSILTYLIAGSTFALVVNTRKVKKTGFIRFFEPSWMWIVSAIVFLTNPQFASFIRATTFGKLSGFKNLHSLMSVVLYTLYLACAIYALSVLTMFVTQKMLRTREFEKRIKGLGKLQV